MIKERSLVASLLGMTAARLRLRGKVKKRAADRPPRFLLRCSLPYGRRERSFQLLTVVFLPPGALSFFTVFSVV
jgi:hypothetical protein